MGYGREAMGNGWISDGVVVSGVNDAKQCGVNIVRSTGGL